MSYSRKVYVKAASTLERRRSKAEHTQSMHREEAYAKIPELISIDREISSAGAEVIRAIGMGENAQRFIEELSKKNLAAQQRRKDILKENGYPEDYLDADYTCKKMPRHRIRQRRDVRLLQRTSARHCSCGTQ